MAAGAGCFWGPPLRKVVGGSGGGVFASDPHAGPGLQNTFCGFAVEWRLLWEDEFRKKYMSSCSCALPDVQNCKPESSCLSQISLWDGVCLSNRESSVVLVKGGRYDFYVSEEALPTEESAYFLMPSRNLLQGWHHWKSVREVRFCLSEVKKSTWN